MFQAQPFRCKWRGDFREGFQAPNCSASIFHVVISCWWFRNPASQLIYREYQHVSEGFIDSRWLAGFQPSIVWICFVDPAAISLSAYLHVKSCISTATPNQHLSDYQPQAPQTSPSWYHIVRKEDAWSDPCARGYPDSTGSATCFHQKKCHDFSLNQKCALLSSHSQEWTVVKIPKNAKYLGCSPSIHWPGNSAETVWCTSISSSRRRKSGAPRGGLEKHPGFFSAKTTPQKKTGYKSG